MHEQEPGLDLSLAYTAIDGDPNPMCGHDHLPPAYATCPPARSRARVSALVVSTRTMSRLYSTEPRRSASGLAASAASCAARLMQSWSRRLPWRNAAAECPCSGVGPTLVRPIPARVQMPVASMVT